MMGQQLVSDRHRYLGGIIVIDATELFMQNLIRVSALVGLLDDVTVQAIK